MMRLRDRHDAGEKLAQALAAYRGIPECIVIALPRGGVVVGYEVANALKLPLDIVCPRKIGAPFNPEFAIGAITETGEGVFGGAVAEYDISTEYLKEAIDREKKVALHRLRDYRGDRPPRNLTDKVVIIVDDGLATGSTMEAAIKTVQKEGAKKIVVAVPVSPPDTLERIRLQVDEAVALMTPQAFMAVGQFYEVFDQTEDDEVIALLQATQKISG